MSHKINVLVSCDQIKTVHRNKISDVHKKNKKLKNMSFHAEHP